MESLAFFSRPDRSDTLADNEKIDGINAFDFSALRQLSRLKSRVLTLNDVCCLIGGGGVIDVAPLSNLRALNSLDLKPLAQWTEIKLSRTS
jgi:hypothetical protein